jgi:hypothetical protein
MVVGKRTLDQCKAVPGAEMTGVALWPMISVIWDWLRSSATGFVRLAAISAVLFGLLGSRGLSTELAIGEVIETIEVVVSINWRHHESETFSASDREFSRRKCVRIHGRSTNIVRCCCRHFNPEIRYSFLSDGHRRPDNSIAPLRI